MKDPICGMDVKEPPVIKTERGGVVYGFCSEACLNKFNLGGAPQAMGAEPKSTKGYWILAGVFLFLVGATCVKRQLSGGWALYETMADFMGFFFVTFGGFKLLDLKGFADAFSTYDLLAAKARIYALCYPFVQLTMGLAYLFRFHLESVSVLALGVMILSSSGVIRALISKRKIRCACLGTKIALPMSTISLVEDVLMALMAGAMLF